MRGSRSSFGIGCWLNEAFALAMMAGAVGIAGCSKSTAPADVGPTKSVEASGPIAPRASPSPPADTDAGTADRAASEPAGADASTAYEVAAPISGRSVGHTSVVFKLKLEGGVDVAYKPRSTRGGHRYRGEVAAYRLARALGLDNVPFATIRVFDYGALQRAVGRETTFAEVVKEGAAAPDASPADGNADSVRGALIPWIKGLELATVDREAEISRWRSWLRADGAMPPDDQRQIASQIATMLTFDYVTGNWDRWSGGNVGIDSKKSELLFIDNDGAFLDPVPVKEMRRGEDLFGGVDRFSRTFVAALRTVDLASAFGDEVPGEPLLSARIVKQTDARRKAALAIIDRKIAKLGESAVLVFE